MTNKERLPQPHTVFLRKPGQSILINPGRDDEIKLTVAKIIKHGEQLNLKDYQSDNEVAIVVSDIKKRRAVLILHAREGIKFLREELVGHSPYTKLFNIVQNQPVAKPKVSEEKVA